MADPCGTGGVALYLDRLGDQAGPASPLAEAEGQPWHPPLSCPSRVGDREGQGSGRRSDTSAAINALQAAMDTLLEAKDSEIAGLKEAFEIALSAKDSEIVSLRNQWERGMAYLDAERTRADELRERLDRLGAKLTDAQAELATAQDQAEATSANAEAAQIAQSEAEADAAELRQVEAERRARGVLARLRAAWRGE